jgi:HSP20 family molecular chaperone IbpA
MRRRNFDSIFDQLFNDLNTFHYSVRTNGNTNINENQEDNYEVDYTNDGAYCFFDVPGFNKSNLKVELENGTVFIEGTKSYKLNGQEKTRTISQKFKIGEGYDASSLEATVEDGVLTLYVPNMKKNEGKKRVSLL